MAPRTRARRGKRRKGARCVLQTGVAALGRVKRRSKTTDELVSRRERLSSVKRASIPGERGEGERQLTRVTRSLKHVQNLDLVVDAFGVVPTKTGAQGEANDRPTRRDGTYAQNADRWLSIAARVSGLDGSRRRATHIQEPKGRIRQPDGSNPSAWAV